MKKFVCAASLLAFVLAALPAPAAAAPVPPIRESFAGELAPLGVEFTNLITTRQEDPAAALRQIDRMLAKLTASSRARGMALMLRAGYLNDLNRPAEAIHAIEESIRLLPNFSGPLYLASDTYTFAGNPGRGADLLLQASRIDPHIMRAMDDYTLNGLLSRLRENGADDRLAAVSERLLAINWTKGSLKTSDTVIFSALESRLAIGDVHGARTLIPRLIAPDKVVTLLIDKRYDAVRDTALAHAGPRLANLWPGFLERAEADSRQHEAGIGDMVYASALWDAGAASKLITTFLPRFSKPLDEERDQGLILAVSSLAGALASQGRWDEAMEVFDTALRTWPDEDKAYALNLTGNRGRLLVMKGDHAAGLAQLEVVIAQAERIGGEVNEGGVSAFHLYRACALHRLGRGREAATSDAVVTRRRTLAPGQYINLQICRDDLPGAKASLIEALHSTETRGTALTLIQPNGDLDPDGAWARQLRTSWATLERDPEIRAVALRYGYILAEPVNAAVREPEGRPHPAGGKPAPTRQEKK